MSSLGIRRDPDTQLLTAEFEYGLRREAIYSLLRMLARELPGGILGLPGESISGKLLTAAYELRGIDEWLSEYFRTSIVTVGCASIARMPIEIALITLKADGLRRVVIPVIGEKAIGVRLILKELLDKLVPKSENWIWPIGQYGFDSILLPLVRIPIKYTKVEDNVYEFHSYSINKQDPGPSLLVPPSVMQPRLEVISYRERTLLRSGKVHYRNVQVDKFIHRTEVLPELAVRSRDPAYHIQYSKESAILQIRDHLVKLGPDNRMVGLDNEEGWEIV